jgi:hypothetical protein
VKADDTQFRQGRDFEGHRDADDPTPDEYPPVDEQLLADYPELAKLIERDQSCARCGARIGRRLCAGCV